jgi:hypothetical protein
MLGEQFAAPLVLAAVWFAWQGDRRRGLVGLGVCIGVALVTYYHVILILGWLIPLKWLQLRRKQAIVWALGPAAAFAALLMAYNWACFGGPFTTSYAHWQGGKARLQLTLPTLWQVHLAAFSSWKGVFYYSPWLLFCAVGAAALWRRERLWPAYGLVAAFSYSGFLLLNNQPDGHYWWGGDDFGARAFVPLLPVLAIGAAAGITRLLSQARRVALLALVAAAVGFSVFACSLGALTSPVTYELTYENGSYYVQRHPHEPKVKLDDVRNPLFDTTFRALLRCGSNNFLTQILASTDVAAGRTRGAWALNMATNLVPLAVLAWVWRTAIKVDEASRFVESTSRDGSSTVE